MLIKELKAEVLAMEKLVEQKNKDEGREKGEEGVHGSVGPTEFQSSHTKFGFNSTFVQAANINTDFEGEGGIYKDKSNMYKHMKEGHTYVTRVVH